METVDMRALKALAFNRHASSILATGNLDLEIG
jgi:hypothetical protein